MGDTGMRRTGWYVAGVIGLALVGILARTAHRHPALGAAAPKGSTLTWPWLPGGALTPPPHFKGIPFGVKAEPDASLPDGQVTLVHAGRQGLQYVGINQAVTVEPPESAVVARGTAVVHTLTVGGHTYRYLRVLSMVATAYNGSYAMNGPWGAVSAWTGEPLRSGDVAVDPHVIPLGTHLYVEGYGPALADDTGSAIVGDRIDLFYPESAAAVARYGIRIVKVYVLAPGS
jgi:3D (Asp-Asp-Asp) domain-containing protein